MRDKYTPRPEQVPLYAPLLLPSRRDIQIGHVRPVVHRDLLEARHAAVEIHGPVALAELQAQRVVRIDLGRFDGLGDDGFREGGRAAREADGDAGEGGGGDDVGGDAGAEEADVDGGIAEFGRGRQAALGFWGGAQAVEDGEGGEDGGRRGRAEPGVA